MEPNTIALVCLLFIILLYFISVTHNARAFRKSKRFFISYVTQKVHQPAMFQNCVVDIDPIKWQIQQNENSNGMRYRVISWHVVSVKQANIFEEGKHSR